VWSIRTGPFDKPELIAEVLKVGFIEKECIITGGFTVTKVLHRHDKRRRLKDPASKYKPIVLSALGTLAGVFDIAALTATFRTQPKKMWILDQLSTIPRHYVSPWSNSFVFRDIFSKRRVSWHWAGRIPSPIRRDS
jgi:hypothetical protein